MDKHDYYAQLWDIVASIRDAYPRLHDDAPTDEIVEAVVDRVLMPALEKVRAEERERIAEALERRVIDNPTGDVAVGLNEAYRRAARIAREEAIR